MDSKFVSAGEANVEQVEHQGKGGPPILDASLNPSETVSYGKQGISGLISSPFIFGAALIASMGGFSFGYDHLRPPLPSCSLRFPGVISIINVMDQFHAVYPQAETAFGKGLMTGMLEFGAFLGCFFMPALADRISRKRAIAFVVIILNIGAIMNFGNAPIYISEISPPNLRGTLLVLESISIVGGVVISFWITYGTRHPESEASFRIPFGLQMVSSTLLGLGILAFPYSPRWLALVDRPEDALSSLSRLRGLLPTDSRVQAEHRGILTEVAIQKKMQHKKHPGVGGIRLEVVEWLDVFKLRRRTVIGVGVAFFQQFSGI
ncbi:hypothetical protein diail_9081 [Diaporthe ilicicola]|nr:hypothetical protein diail_9081 [Diaporthe ilicicola]